jgi:hypothetical protein
MPKDFEQTEHLKEWYLQVFHAESNNLVRDFELSMDQQRTLILSYLPGNEFVYRFLSMHDKLPDMLKTISLYATNVVTRNELEKQLNAWMLVNTTENEMYMSIIKLIDMLNRIREDYGINPPNIPELYSRPSLGFRGRLTSLVRFVISCMRLGLGFGQKTA